MTARGVVVTSLVLIALCSCGIPVEDRARPLSADQVPSSLPGSGPTSTVPPGDPGPAATEVFFVRGSRLEPVARPARVPRSVENAIATLVGGPTPAERSEGVRTALTRPVRLAGTVAAGVPLIDVTESFAEVEGEELILALAQLVFTITGLPGVDGVSFARAGRPVEVPTADGTLKGGVLRRTDYAAVAPAD